LASLRLTKRVITRRIVKKLKALLAGVAAFAALLVVPTTAEAASTVYCHEYSDLELRFVTPGHIPPGATGGGSRRIDSDTVEIQWRTPINDHIQVVTDDAGVVFAANETNGDWSVDITARGAHWYSLRSYGTGHYIYFGVGNTAIWQSSLGIDAPSGWPNPDNHCGTAKYYIQ